MDVKNFVGSGKNFVTERFSLNHAPYRRGVQMAYFEIQAMIRCYHQYKVIWNAKFGEELECQRETGNTHDISAVIVLKSATA